MAATSSFREPPSLERSYYMRRYELRKVLKRIQKYQYQEEEMDNFIKNELRMRLSILDMSDKYDEIINNPNFSKEEINFLDQQIKEYEQKFMNALDRADQTAQWIIDEGLDEFLVEDNYPPNFRVFMTKQSSNIISSLEWKIYSRIYDPIIPISGKLAEFVDNYRKYFYTRNGALTKWIEKDLSKIYDIALRKNHKDVANKAYLKARDGPNFNISSFFSASLRNGIFPHEMVDEARDKNWKLPDAYTITEMAGISGNLNLIKSIQETIIPQLSTNQFYEIIMDVAIEYTRINVFNWAYGMVITKNIDYLVYNAIYNDDPKNISIVHDLLVLNEGDTQLIWKAMASALKNFNELAYTYLITNWFYFKEMGPDNLYKLMKKFLKIPPQRLSHNFDFIMRILDDFIISGNYINYDIVREISENLLFIEKPSAYYQNRYMAQISRLNIFLTKNYALLNYQRLYEETLTKGQYLVSNLIDSLSQKSDIDLYKDAGWIVENFVRLKSFYQVEKLQDRFFDQTIFQKILPSVLIQTDINNSKLILQFFYQTYNDSDSKLNFKQLFNDIVKQIDSSNSMINSKILIILEIVEIGVRRQNSVPDYQQILNIPRNRNTFDLIQRANEKLSKDSNNEKNFEEMNQAMSSTMI